MESAGEYIHSNHRYKGNFTNNEVSYKTYFKKSLILEILRIKNKKKNKGVGFLD